MVYEGLNVGDETRRHGDYIGLPHGVTDGKAVADLGTLDRGVPVVYDGSAITEATADGDTIVGVLYAFDVYGDSTNAGPYVDGDSDATVKTSGTVKADLSQLGDGVAEADEGTALGGNGELLILNVLDADNDIAEVLLR